MSANDPFKLNALFAGGEAWLPLLEAQPELADDLGPGRDNSIVPVRELTFQVLKPNPPEAWKVVFGQNHPRVESAAGIAMFDNPFNAWSDSRFGAVTFLRCIVKSPCMWKHGLPKTTSVAEIRTLLGKQAVVPTPEWFQAVLTQGVLLMKAALTASSGAERTPAQHSAFCQPVVRRPRRPFSRPSSRPPRPRRAAWCSPMGAFISHTMELHRLDLERLGEDLAAIEGVAAAPLLELWATTAPIAAVLKGLSPVVSGRACVRDEVACPRARRRWRWRVRSSARKGRAVSSRCRRPRRSAAGPSRPSPGKTSSCSRPAPASRCSR
jgi:hypothetical protein